MNRAIFYVYALLDTRKPGKFVYEKDDQKLEFDYEPYYIGKGGTIDNNRPIDHLKECRKKYCKHCNNHKLNIIRALVKENLEFKYIYLKENLTEKESFDYEIFCISLIRRSDLNQGPLTNLTDGGEGVGGYKHSEQNKDLFSQLNSKSYIERYGETKALDEIKKRSISHLGEKHSFERSKKQSETMTKKFENGYKVWNKDLNFFSDKDCQNIIDLYLFKELSIEDIRKIYKCSSTPIKRILNKQSIKLRSKSEILTIRHKNKKMSIN